MKTLDWIVIGLYALLSSSLAGLLVRKYVRNTADFLVADRGLRFYLGVASMFSTEFAIITAMALSQMGYEMGFTALTLGICFSIGVTFVGATGFITSRLRQLRVMTIPEFYRMRYGPFIRWFGGLILAISGVINMGVFIRTGGRFFAAISGVPDQTVITISMTVLLILALVYAFMGGMLSVVFVGYLQFIIIVLGVTTATVFTLHEVGFGHMVETVRTSYAAKGFNPFVDEKVGLPFILFNTLVFVTVPTLWQPAATLGLSAKEVKTGRRMYFWSGLTYMGRGTIPILWGIAALAYFNLHPLPAGKEVESVMRMPLMFSKILPTGFIGIFVAAMFGAEMAVYSTYLVAWAGIVTQDVISPLFPGGLTERMHIRINRIMIVLIGLFLLWWGLYFTPPLRYFLYQQLTATIYLAGALAVVTLGLYWKRANSIGAFAAILVGTVFPVISVIFKEDIPRLPSYLQFLNNESKAGMFTFLLSFAVMIVVSLATSPWLPARTLPRVEESPAAEAGLNMSRS